MSILNLLHAVVVAQRAESLTPSQIQDLQQSRFRKLLRHALEKSRFYQRYYQEHGITGRDIDQVEPDDLPVIDKRIVMENYDELVCDPTLKRDEIERFVRESPDPSSRYKGAYKVIHTSGSSGTAGLFVYGPRDWAVAKALGYRAIREKVNPFRRKKLAYMGAAGGHYASVTTISDIPSVFFKTLTLSISHPLEQICRDTDRFQPDAVIGYASGLDLLAREQMAGHLRIVPRRIWSSADPLTQTIRANIEKAFGVSPTNIYTASEIMTFSVECDLHHRLHYFNDWFSIQVVDDDLAPVERGQTGRMVATNLYNYTQPLIRYRMDDEIVLSDEPCPCGWPFPVIERIAGRNEETLWFARADGTREFVSPYILEEFSMPGLKKFQFVQTDPDRLIMKAVLDGERASVIPAIHKRMTEILSPKGLEKTVQFEVEPVDQIRNDPKTSKFRLVVPYRDK
jgi:phenylacetate-CoA ligase